LPLANLATTGLVKLKLLSGSNKISSKEIAVMNFNKFLKNIKK